MILRTRPSFYVVRALFTLEKAPGVISLLAGKPNPDLFPITSVQITVRSAADDAGAPALPITLGNKELAAGLQYGDTAGYQPLIDWLVGLQTFAHGRKIGEGWRISMGAGSQDSLYKVKYSVGTGEVLYSEAFIGV